MARVKVKVRYPRPDIKKTRENNHKAMVKFTFDTLKVWVLETTNPIPVWSGAARASFLFLAAKAQTSITINPIVDSRLSLGITEAKAEVFMKKGSLYGWSWQTDLVHMPIVEERVGFVQAGLKAIKNMKPKLPQPATKPTKG
jgi:hypothetical protein